MRQQKIDLNFKAAEEMVSFSLLGRSVSIRTDLFRDSCECV